MPRSIGELRLRRTACDGLIRFLINECADDPRQPDTLEHYKAQLHKLDTELAEAERLERQRLGIPEPPDIVIGLKPAILFGKSDKVR